MNAKAVTCVAALVLFVSAPAGAVQQVPASPNTMKVTNLYTVNEGITAFGTGSQMFEFTTDTGIVFGTGWSCIYSWNGTSATTSWFGVPKANPNPGGTGENPAYRDAVNALMLAFALNKPIVLMVDGCIGGVPRVVTVWVQQ